MDFLPGDVQLVHDHTLLHDRTAFEDWPEPERKRHHLRMWLAPSEACPLPPVFAQRSGSVTPGDRDGVISKAPTKFCQHQPVDASAVACGRSGHSRGRWNATAD
jgi:hypothetical protein